MGRTTPRAPQDNDANQAVTYRAARLLILGGEEADEVASIVEGILDDPSEDESRQPGQLAIAMALFLEAPEIAWERFTSRMRDLEREFACRLACEIFERVRGPRGFDLGAYLYLDQLGEETCAEILIWLDEVFPEVTGRFDQHHIRNEGVALVKDRMLTHLERRATPSALEAIKRIEGVVPSKADVARMSYRLGTRNVLTKEWTPTPPSELCKLLQHPEQRYVNGPGQLLDVVVESLNRLQERFRSPNRVAFSLWDEVLDSKGRRTGRYRPKDEEHFSEFIRDHLQQDLGHRRIIANREVQVDLGGQRTDVWIQATTRSSQPVTAVVEVKGIWHDKVKTAMGDQLVGQYLTGGVRAGVYLVGWFRCPGWDSSDSRHSKNTDNFPTQASLERHLDDQITKLESAHNVHLRRFLLETGLTT